MGDTPPAMKKCVVMVVEDDEAIAGYLSLALEQEDYEVFVATDGNQGLEMIRSHRPNLVLLDLMLPGMNGLAILHHMAERPDTASIPVAVVSAYADAGDTRKALDRSPNVRRVFTKPFRTDDLLAQVKELAEGK